MSAHLTAPWTEAHGHRGDSKWPMPRLVARSNTANRVWISSRPFPTGADQGNQTLANEYMDDPDVLKAKMKLIAGLLVKSPFVVAYTGAGLSRASGIPDYASKAANSVMASVPKLTSSLDAEPTFAHHVLANLANHDPPLLHHWLQQNHDGLPQKAGFPQEKINEIHGAWFDPANPVVKFSGSLRSDLFQWMIDVERRADLTLCLGTSLSGMNADRLAETPCRRMLKGTATGTVIINLQRTRLDEQSAVRVWAKLDDAFRILLEELGMKMKLGKCVVPKTNVFHVPYNAQGKLDRSVQMTLDLRRGQKVFVVHEDACNKGAKGTVVGQTPEGDWVVNVDHRRRYGRWWIEAALRGAVPDLPVINVNPEIKAAQTKPVKAGASGEADLVAKLVEMGFEEGTAKGAIAMTGTVEGALGLLAEGEQAEKAAVVGERETADRSPDALTTPPIEAKTPWSEGFAGPVAVVQMHKLRVDPVMGNKHHWGLQVAPEAWPLVKKVAYDLHPTFRKPHVVCDEPPFGIERFGWGFFTVGISAELKNGKVVKGEHELAFDAQGDDVKVTALE